MQVKFCGLQTMADVDVVNRLHPDMAGFVFVPESSRCLHPEEAAVLKSRLDPGISAVGVFANQDPAEIEMLVDTGVIDMIQLHGSEPPEMIRRLQQKAPVIRAFRIRQASDLQPALTSCADHVLLDAGAGQGRTFDWSLLKGFARPYILAGGLCPENAAAACALHPRALDVSSGIETAGRKDPQKMAAFLAAIGIHERDTEGGTGR